MIDTVTSVSIVLSPSIFFSWCKTDTISLYIVLLFQPDAGIRRENLSHSTFLPLFLLPLDSGISRHRLFPFLSSEFWN